MSSVKEKLKALNDKLTEYEEKLKEIESGVKKLKSQAETDQNTILKQEKELKEIRSKLLICQQEKEKYQDLLNKQVKKLEDNKLPNQEQDKQLVSMINDSVNRLSSCSHSLNKVWTDYGDVRDKVISILQERDKHAYEAIKAINHTKKGLWITVWILLGVVALLSLSLSLSLVIITKKRNK